MRLGQAAMEALRAEITGCLQPGDELAVVCPVGLKGTSIIAEQKKERLAEQFSAGFIYNCRTLFRDYGAGETVSVKDSTVWKMVQEAGALWKMAEASQVGLTVDFRKVPIRQETIEVCEIFDINPYRLESEGSVLLGIRGGQELVQKLRQEGYMAEIIGQTNDGNDRLLYSGSGVRYLERPGEDEIYKIKML